jgi:Na+/glutamate symporter
MAAPAAPPKPQTTRPPDLPEVFIILLISVGVVIFVFWISTQFLGASTFQNLPPWLMAVFKNVWAAVGTGATGIALALLKAFTTRDSHSRTISCTSRSGYSPCYR